MPNHEILGDYIVGQDGDVEFASMTISGVDIDPAIYTDGSQIPDADFAVLCDLFSQAQTLAAVARAHVVATWKEDFLELVDDLVVSNPDTDILGEMFPGAGVNSVADINQDLVAKSIQVTNVMGWYGKGEGHTFTIDVRFKEGAFDQILAVRFDDAGSVVAVSQES